MLLWGLFVPFLTYQVLKNEQVWRRSLALPFGVHCILMMYCRMYCLCQIRVEKQNGRKDSKFL